MTQERILRFLCDLFPSARGGRERPNTNILFIIHDFPSYVNSLFAFLSGLWNLTGLARRPPCGQAYCPLQDQPEQSRDPAPAA